MTLGVTQGNNIDQVVHDVVQKYAASRDELIPILNEINRKIGYLPNEDLRKSVSCSSFHKAKFFRLRLFTRCSQQNHVASM